MAVATTGITALYGGEDIGALVFDLGHMSFRVGYAQDDYPRAEIPTVVGVKFGNVGAARVDGALSSKINSFQGKYYVGTNYVTVPREDVECVPFLQDGMVEDWDLLEKVLDYTYDTVFRTESERHPLLMTEPAWNYKVKREKMTELLFEKYNIPAFYMCKSAALAAFSNGRSSAMIVDSGLTRTAAVPVIDSFVVSKGIAISPLGRDYLARQCKQYLADQKIDVVLPYQVAAKEIVKEKEPAIWTMKSNLPEVRGSWRLYMEKKVLYDFARCVLQVSDKPFDEKKASNAVPAHYEFPNGYHQDFGADRFKISESLFNPHHVQIKGFKTSHQYNIANVVAKSISLCDADARPTLCSNVIITGGNSLIPGFTQRFNRELSAKLPNSLKTKVIASPGSAERRFAAWMGGSIMCGIGSFQKLWISSIEYQECGKSVIEKKCA